MRGSKVCEIVGTHPNPTGENQRALAQCKVAPLAKRRVGRKPCRINEALTYEESNRRGTSAAQRLGAIIREHACSCSLGAGVVTVGG